MKKIIFTTCLSLCLSSPVLAKELGSFSITEAGISSCREMSHMVGFIASAREQGIKQAQLEQVALAMVASKSNDEQELYVDMVKNIVNKAYQQAAESNQADKVTMVSHLQDMYFLSCVNGFSRKMLQD